MDLSINYPAGADLVQGIPLSIAAHSIPKGELKKADIPGSKHTLMIRIANDIHMIPRLENVLLKEVWTETIKVPEKTAPAPPKPAAEPKKEGEAPAAEGETPAAEPEKPATEQTYTEKQKIREETRSILAKCTTMNHAIPPNRKTELKQAEEAMYQEDWKLLGLKEAKYNLESYTYDMKNNVDSYGNYEHFIDPAEKAPFMETLAATEAWIYSDGENATLEETAAKLQALQATGEPIKTRYKFRSEFEEWFGIFSKFQTEAVEKSKNIPHLTPEQLKDMDGKLEHLTNEFCGIRDTLDKTEKHKDLPYTVSEIENKIYAVKAEVNGILNAPPPAPKKAPEEEKKEDTPTADAPDGEVPEASAPDGGAAGAGTGDVPTAGEGETPE